MSVIIILLIVSLSIATLFLVAFIWNVKTGQYDDEVSPAIRILFDDRTPAAPSIREEKEPQTSAIENHF